MYSVSIQFTIHMWEQRNKSELVNQTCTFLIRLYENTWMCPDVLIKHLLLCSRSTMKQNKTKRATQNTEGLLYSWTISISWAGQHRPIILKETLRLFWKQSHAFQWKDQYGFSFLCTYCIVLLIRKKKTCLSLNTT